MEGNYYHCSELQPLGRPEEDVLLERELMAMFPGILKDVRLVREEKELAGSNDSVARQGLGNR